ncbi:hypothetical protein Tco_1482871 [Tanacetum coccineum]
MRGARERAYAIDGGLWMMLVMTLIEMWQRSGVAVTFKARWQSSEKFFDGGSDGSLAGAGGFLDFDTTTLRDLIDSDGKLILEDPQPGVPRFCIPRPPRASMQDLYDRMGHMEIRQDVIEWMEYRQSYH